jgi:hypothetical protein
MLSVRTRLAALALGLLVAGCDEPTAQEMREDARIAGKMERAAAQRDSDAVADDRSAADARSRVQIDARNRRDAARTEGISPVDR